MEYPNTYYITNSSIIGTTIAVPLNDPGFMETFKEVRDECGSVILAWVYFFFLGVVNLTMMNVYRLFRVKKENITLLAAEKFLVATTFFFIALIILSEYFNPLGWAVVILGNIRILQILSLNFLTLIFDFSPSADKTARKKRTRWHFLALAFSLFDILLIFAFMYQFLDSKYLVFNNHFDELFSYFYFAVVTASTVGYGDIFPVTVFGKMLVTYEIIIAICVIIFSLSGVLGRFQQEASS